MPNQITIRRTPGSYDRLRSARRKKRRYKKYGKKSRLAINRPISIVDQQSPLPVSMKVRFRYASYDGLAFSAGIDLLSLVYSANGLYDPDIGGIGHQPSGFDQLMTMYDHYTVIGAKIVCTFVNTADRPIVAGIDVSDSSTISTDYREIIESGTCTYNHLAPQGSGKSSCTLSYPLSIGKYLGISKLMSSSNARGNTSTNPQEQCFFFPFVYAPSISENVRIPINVTIEYQAVLTEPKAVGIS